MPMRPVIVDAPALAANRGLGRARHAIDRRGLARGPSRKAALVLNKIDAMKRAELLPLAERLNATKACSRRCS
jgi:hypothetical protein